MQRWVLETPRRLCSRVSDHRQHLADLFGLAKLDDDESTDSKKVGKNAAESEKLGRKALLQGNVPLAIEHFERGIEQGSTSTRFDLAAAYEAAGRDEDAQALYQELLKEDSDFAEGYFGMSEVLKRSARFTEALDQLHRAIAKEPSNAHFHFKLAELLKDQRLYADATVAAERAALTEPDNAFYHFYLGDLLIDRKYFAEALEAFRHAVELSPGDDHYLLRSAVAFWGAGKQNEAIRALRLSQELAKDSAIARGLEVQFRRQLGETLEEVELDSYDVDRIERILSELGLTSLPKD